MTRNKLLIIMLMACSGCQTPRLHTDQELRWLGAAVAGQAADLATTAAALQRDDMRDANPVFGDRHVLQHVAISKVALLGATWALSYAYPEQRKSWYKWLAGMGGAAASWNVYQISQ